jgi:hypothetical protein
VARNKEKKSTYLPISGMTGISKELGLSMMAIKPMPNSQKKTKTQSKRVNLVLVFVALVVRFVGARVTALNNVFEGVGERGESIVIRILALERNVGHTGLAVTTSTTPGFSLSGCMTTVTSSRSWSLNVLVRLN